MPTPDEVILRAYAGDVRQWLATVESQNLKQRIKERGCNFTGLCIQMEYDGDEFAALTGNSGILQYILTARPCVALGLKVYPGLTLAASGYKLDYLSQASYRARSEWVRLFRSKISSYQELQPPGFFLDVEAYPVADTALPEVVDTSATWKMNSLPALLGMIRAAMAFRDNAPNLPPLWILPALVDGTETRFEYWPILAALKARYCCDEGLFAVADAFLDDETFDPDDENAWRDYLNLERLQLPDANPLYRQPQEPLARAIGAQWVPPTRVQLLRNSNAARWLAYRDFTGHRPLYWAEMSGANRTHWIQNPTEYMPV